jgi:23S rRNA pseudouridine1911/1915/1917 synthase
MEFDIIFEDKDLLVIDKPTGKNSDDFEKRVHRLDKDTSGILLVAKNDKALDFFQKQFKNREVSKKYIALAVGEIKTSEGEIKTLIGRDKKNRKKQKAYLATEPDAKTKGLREALTKYKILEKFKDYTLLEVQPKTGRKHQIRCHFAYLGHPIAGDKLYGFKNQPCPKGLNRQFLHASQLKIKLLNGEKKEFKSDLPKELKQILQNLCQ